MASSFFGPQKPAETSMGTPLSVLMSTNGQIQEPNKTCLRSDSTKPESTTVRGRKPGSKAPSRKKQPQRGMGVAQLERLRVQERLKTITGANQLESLNLQPAQLPGLDPINSVPLQYGTVNYGVPIMNGGGLWGLNQAMLAKRTYNGGYNGAFGSGQVWTNPYMVGASDMRVQVGVVAAAAASSVFETSSELSSMPKTMHQHEPTHCDVCFKKKKSYGGNIGYNGRRDNYAETSPIIGSDFLGWNQENNINFNGEMDGFKARAARSAFYANGNLYEGVEVMAIHRNNTSVGRSVFMEYEFFPGKNGTSTSFKKVEFPAEAASGAMGCEASCVTISDYSGCSGSNASNSVDLSLKL